MKFTIFVLLFLFPLSAFCEEQLSPLDKVYQNLQKEQRYVPSSPVNLTPEQEIKRMRRIILELQVENTRLRLKVNDLESKSPPFHETNEENQRVKVVREQENSLFVMRVHYLLQNIKMIEVLMQEEDTGDYTITLNSFYFEILGQLESLGIDPGFVEDVDYIRNLEYTRGMLIRGEYIDE